jgi:ABC-type nitrate/sulfonate/bicarbonate transport system substrate-binding protein
LAAAATRIARAMRHRRKQSWKSGPTLIAVGLAGAAALAAVGYVFRFQPDVALPVPAALVSASVRLDGPFDPRFAGEIVAERAGLFARENLRIELRPGAPDADPIRRVAGGDDTIGVAEAERFLLARGAGVPLVAFAAAYLESPVLLYALETSGIRTPYDFAAKRIGHRPGGDTALIYDAMMTKLQLPRGETREVPAGPDPAPLLRGEIDVWPGHVGTEAYAFKQAGIAANVISPASHGVHVPGTVYFASEKTLRDNPSLVRRFLRAVIAGWQLAYEDDAASIPLIVSSDRTTLTPDLVRFALAQQREFLRPLGARFGEFDDTRWRSLQNILLQQKLLKQPLDLSRAVTYEFLRDAYRTTGALAQ